MNFDKTNCIIIIMTHSNYIDVCNNFIELLYENWKDCPFDIIAGVVGQNKKVKRVKNIYIGESKQLTDCITVISNEHNADYYMCFLGDAFINQKVLNDEVFCLLNELSKKDINYCRIVTRKYEKHNSIYRYIKSNDIYCHSFVGFIATKQFINQEFSGVSDLEFEKKYLVLANNKEISFVFKDRVMLLKDIFHIEPGIVKGKWDRIAYYKIKKQNPKIHLTEREKISWMEELKILLINFNQRFVPSYLRIKIKKLLTLLGVKFTTKY
ncbi:hypothetical protein [Faecalibacillus intestinalis]|uniref:hypothetical protein n=1 Tax=Faecalibacillus intestinalis TaxID=1982626 RepID=UPI0022E4F1AA|nr:hypothetical protein [Faecalibacillus intestinalis]